MSAARAARHSGPVPTLNVANLVTLSRLALVPLFAGCLAMMHHESVWRWLAFALFSVAALTDQLDGWLARKYNVVTAFGTFTDPLADKILIGTAFVGLSVVGELAWWITIVIMTREIVVTLLRIVLLRDVVLAANWGGKAKTVSQILAIMSFLLPLPAGLDPLRWALVAIALGLTIITGAVYLRRGISLRGTARRAETVR